MSETNELATLEIRDRIATLTLNRPEQRNALSIPLLAALHGRVDELETAADVRTVVLSGAGKSFCAGMDLKAVLHEPGAPAVLLESLANLTYRLRALPMVVVAKINGAAIGGGCGLSCVADVSITHADAKLGFPEVDLGVCPAVVTPWLVRKIGSGPARAVLLRGGTMDGTRARHLGIVDVCVSSREELDGETEAIAERLAAGGRDALAATKGLLNELDGSVDMDVLQRAAALSANVVAGEEAQRTLRQRFGMN